MLAVPSVRPADADEKLNAALKGWEKPRDGPPPMTYHIGDALPAGFDFSRYIKIQDASKMQIEVAKPSKSQRAEVADVETKKEPSPVAERTAKPSDLARERLTKGMALDMGTLVERQGYTAGGP